MATCRRCGGHVWEGEDCEPCAEERARLLPREAGPCRVCESQPGVQPGGLCLDCWGITVAAGGTLHREGDVVVLSCEAGDYIIDLQGYG